MLWAMGVVSRRSTRVESVAVIVGLVDKSGSFLRPSPANDHGTPVKCSFKFVSYRINIFIT